MKTAIAFVICCATFLCAAGMSQDDSAVGPSTSLREAPEEASSEQPARKTQDAEYLVLRVKLEHQVPTTQLGVHVRQADRTLRRHLGVADGMGLVVDEVVSDSAAAEAGLRMDDVLLKLDDQWLINQEQLTVLVRKRKPGEQATLTLYRDGKQQTVVAGFKVSATQLPQELINLSLEAMPRSEGAAFTLYDDVKLMARKSQDAGEAFDVHGHALEAKHSNCMSCHVSLIPSSPHR